MDQTGNTDITALLRHLCIALQPFANTRNIQLHFSGSQEDINVSYPEEELLAGFTKIISMFLDLIPDGNTLLITAGKTKKEGENFASIKLHNTGINLQRVPGLLYNKAVPLKLINTGEKETSFEVCYCLSNSNINNQHKVNGSVLNYTMIVRQIKSHFAKLYDPVKRLAETKPKEAVFLTKINECLLKNLDNESFDANALSDAMAMSRAQLLRRMKSLTGNSPGYYIRNFRLEKAKALLEQEEITVSEAAYQTGFSTLSNFTKVFSEKYGITPSQFRRIKGNATNE